MNILLVEDEARVADFMRRGLAAEGWSIDHVVNGEDALEHAAVNSYDVILLDLMLPGIQGQDVCRKLRARKSKTPILMLTALDSPEERVWGLNADPLTNVVDVYVGRLRRKIGPEGDRIVTLRNVGYRMT